MYYYVEFTKPQEKLAFIITIFQKRKLKHILSRISQLGELVSKSNCVNNVITISTYSSLPSKDSPKGEVFHF